MRVSRKSRPRYTYGGEDFAGIHVIFTHPLMDHASINNDLIDLRGGDGVTVMPPRAPQNQTPPLPQMDKNILSMIERKLFDICHVMRY
jgi:hypothetical protein